MLLERRQDCGIHSLMHPIRLLSSVRFHSYFSLYNLSRGDCIPVGVGKYRYNPGISLNLKSRSRGKKRSFKLILAQKCALVLGMERLKGVGKCLQQNKM